MRQPVLFLISLVFLLLLIGVNVSGSYKYFGELVYPLDDAYIHMAISKNLEQHGVWGVTRFEFSSTSSSILYTLLLAIGFAIVGVKAWLPLAVNGLASVAIVWLVARISLRTIGGLSALIFSLLFVALVPVAGMAILGMEHTLQIFFCTLFLWLTYRKWNGEQVRDWAYAAVAFFAVMSRYESAFVIAITGAVWLFAYRNWKQVILLAIASSLPIIVFGLYAISQGGYFVPNSLLAKSNYVNGGIGGFVIEVSKKILYSSLLASLIIIPLAYWLLFSRGGEKNDRSNAVPMTLLVTGLTCITHQVFASFGWMFRYEAYLIALVFVGAAISWNSWKMYFRERNLLPQAVIAVFAAAMLLPILTRVQIPVFVGRAMKNIHDQHLQMSSFVNRYFPDAGIAMNDIGTTTFFNDNIRLFDMEGLGTLEVLKIKKQLDTTFLRNYVKEHNIGIGIFYPHLYEGKIPPEWELVGTWEITDRFVAAGSVVGFYVIDPSLRQRMIDGLKEYSKNLPAGVIEGGLYRELKE